MKKIGFIGYGLRSEAMWKAFTGIHAPVVLAAIADPRWKELSKQKEQRVEFAHTQFYEEAEEMLEKEKLDGVFIGTRCHLHALYAQKALQYRIPLFLEKPVCINEMQYQQLLCASKGQRHQVVVSFPLRFTSIVQQLKRMVAQGELGNIVTVQAINNVPYGSVYYHSWYRDDSLTGGLFLQKCTHDIDYITYIVNKRPIHVTACTSKMYFKGEKPADLRCCECPEKQTCPESSFVAKYYDKKEPSGEYCCFSQDTGNEDVGAALFTCEDGTILSYHQTFVVKNTAGRRGARFIGTKGSAEFDFYTAELRVDYYDHHHTAIHKFQFPEGLAHFGGDEQLAKDFLRVLDGKPSGSNIEDGLASTAACIAASHSAQTGEKTAIDYGLFT